MIMQYRNEPCGIATLADLVSIKTGKLNSNAAVENGAYPFFTCSRETYKVDTYSFDCEAVLLAGNNANGVYPVKYYKGRFDAYQRTYVIRSIDEGVLNNRYLFYALQLELDLLQSLSTGSATKFLTLTILNALKLRIPSLSDQNRIVSILGAYDDLIENNTRRIEILEEMAWRLYEEWFVQFRFPGYEGAAFKESEVGLIPKGWDLVRLGDCVELAYGKALKAQDRVPGEYSVYGSSGVVGTHCESLVEGPGIVVGRKGNVGSVFWSDASFFPIDTTYYVRSEVPFSYVYFNLQRQRFLNNDAAVPGLNREQAYALPFLLPEQDLLSRFSAEWETIYGLLRRLECINVNLRAQRDLLLPKLISGEIDVSAIPMPT